MAVTVSIMTAFYTFRMLGMTFFGKESKHVKEKEQRGQVHEVGPVMWVPFAILAVASIAVGVVGFAFEHQLHELFSAYLGNTFGIGVGEEGTSSEHGAGMPQSVNSQSQSESSQFLGLDPDGGYSISSIICDWRYTRVLGIHRKKDKSTNCFSKYFYESNLDVSI